MFLPLLISIAVLAPQTPEADVARLAALFSGGAEATAGETANWDRSTSMLLRGWESCGVGLELEAAGAAPARTGRIDWSAVKVQPSASGRVVALEGVTMLDKTPGRSTIHLRFADDAAAAEAAALMARRTTACAPQR